MKHKLLYVYVERIVCVCKMMCLNAHIIRSPQSAKDIFKASLVANIHYGIDTVELIDDLMDIDLIKSCEISMLMSYNFSIMDAMIEYRDSIVAAYFKANSKPLYKFNTKNFM